MEQVLERTTKPKDINTGVRNKTAVADGLRDVLADTYRLVFKTHAYHWNVSGPAFYAIHNLTEDQYNQMFKATDELAERIRALGEPAPIRFSDLTRHSVIEDHDGMPSAGEMISDLLDDHERLSHRLHALVELAAKNNDAVTEDLATQRSAFHEKAAWMLRATLG